MAPESMKLSNVELIAILFCLNMQNSTVEEAIDSLRESGRLQPSLFWAQDMYLFKSDNTTILLRSARCFTEAVELTFVSFWVHVCC